MKAKRARVRPAGTADRSGWREEEATIADLTARYGRFAPMSDERRAQYLWMEADDKRRRAKP